MQPSTLKCTCRQPKTPHGTDGGLSICGVLCWSGTQGSGREEKEKKGKVGEVREEAFAIRTFRNGLGVFVSK